MRRGDDPLLHVAHEAAEAEVEHQRVAAGAGVGDHDVLGLEVAMHDAARVGAAQRVEHVDHQVLGLRQTETTFGGQQLAQRLAGDELEDRVELTVLGLAAVDERDDVRMVELAAQLHLAAEARIVAAVVAVPVAQRTQHLDRDLLPGRQLAGAVDGREAAAARALDDLVAALEDVAGRQRRLGRREVGCGGFGHGCLVSCHATRGRSGYPTVPTALKRNLHPAQSVAEPGAGDTAPLTWAG